VYEIKPREIEVAEGELQELDGKRLAEIEENRAKMFRKREEGQCVTLADFEELAKRRGYAPGWAYHRHKHKTDRRGGAPSLNFGRG
jgi:hypothetical protein